MTGHVRTRQARHEDREAIVAFTEDTWPELGGDYIPRVFDEWVDTDGPAQRTFVATVDDRPVGICQGVLLTGHEAWGQGLRVDPAHRGGDVGRELTETLLEWVAGRGATVCRNMVFSWNAAGLGQARSARFEPVAEFRWVEPHPDPAADGALGADFDVLRDPTIAWSAFHGSDAYHELRGLGLDLEESWALAEVTKERLASAEATLTVADADRARATTYRTRTFERDAGRDDEAGDDGVDAGGDDGDTELWAEYGVGAWDDLESFRALAGAVARDAADQGARKTRMLVPETPRHVSDAAAARVAFSQEPDFVLERDLTRY